MVMLRNPVRRRHRTRGEAAPVQLWSVTMTADSAPASWLRGANVAGPGGEPLGDVALLVRRSDGARLAVVQSHAPDQERRVVSLAGAYLDEAGVLHVLSSADVDLIPA
jgi:hypothetical protein